MHPVITIITDFGTRDGYVGAMKGVIASHAPGVSVMDITHDVPAQDVFSGAWALRNSWPWFPADAIHVIVVDPGVGTNRRGILVRAADQLFIGPDNGIITWAVEGHTIQAAHELSRPPAIAPAPSTTFHGRDVFAWSAGWIAAGGDWSDVGPALSTSELVRLSTTSAEVIDTESERVIHGRVLVADRFGNLVTNIQNSLLDGYAVDSMSADGGAIGVHATFGDVAEGESLAYPGSGDYVEIAVNLGRADQRFSTDSTILMKLSRLTRSS
jgi:S-adenosyl-L-methionine hydrolase (adenosine-forming)